VRPDLINHLSNLQTLCDACHRGKTVRETAGRRRVVGPVRYLPQLCEMPRSAYTKIFATY
jgi:hypothetical protein